MLDPILLAKHSASFFDPDGKPPIWSVLDVLQEREPEGRTEKPSAKFDGGWPSLPMLPAVFATYPLDKRRRSAAPWRRDRHILSDVNRLQIRTDTKPTRSCLAGEGLDSDKLEAERHVKKTRAKNLSI
jgi:hypothetical protein